MRLPAKVSYTCKAALELALQYKGDTPVQLSTISQHQKIPKNFLIQLLIRLKNTGIVASSRGVSGGYFLRKHPSQVSLADIFRAIDDSIIDAPGRPKASGRVDADKLISDIWGKIGNEVVRRLEEIKLEELAAKLKNEELTYYI